MLEHPLRGFRLVLGEARQYKLRRAFPQGENMKDGKNYDYALLQVTVNHNCFTRTVISKIAGLFAMIWLFVLCISISFIDPKSQFSQSWFILGGILAFFIIILAFKDIIDIKTLHRKTTEYEDEVLKNNTLHSKMHPKI